MPLNVCDPWLFDLLAKVVRTGCDSELAVVKVGDNYEVWGHDDPDPFEVRDEAGRVIWQEKVSV